MGVFIEKLKPIISKINSYGILLSIILQLPIFFLDLGHSNNFIILSIKEKFPVFFKYWFAVSISYNDYNKWEFLWKVTGSNNVILYNFILLAMYYIIHTGIIFLKEIAMKKASTGWNQYWYAEFYKFVASTHFYFIILNFMPMNNVIWAWPNGPENVIYWSLITIMFTGIFMINHSPSWLGQWVKKNPGKMCRENIFSYIRHPTYFGMMLVHFSRPVMTAGTLLFTFFQCGYCILAVFYNEEPRMVRVFGKDYEKYMREVPAMVPGSFGDLFGVLGCIFPFVEGKSKSLKKDQ